MAIGKISTDTKALRGPSAKAELLVKMAAVRHLRFVERVFGHPRRVLGGLYRCAKFSWNRRSSFDNNGSFTIFARSA